jgi:hypothetical protein
MVMGMVEKLTKLLLEGHKRHLFYDRIAEFLIANDVVPVVRCKDCKWWKEYHCTNRNGAFGVVENEDWFCCSGERKDND